MFVLPVIQSVLAASARLFSSFPLLSKRRVCGTSALVVTTVAADALFSLKRKMDEATIAVDSKNVIDFFIFKTPKYE